MNLFDTHVHFDGFPVEELPFVVSRAGENGVIRMVAVGGSPQANKSAVAAAARFSGHVVAAVGFDRDCASENPDLDCLEELLAGNLSAGRASAEQAGNVVAGKIAAVGEIGLDFHYGAETQVEQQELFETMLSLAARRSLPVIVHSRNAEDVTLSMLAKHARAWKGNPDRIGVMHCFTGSRRFAGQALDLGFHISFSGIVTFENGADLRLLARYVPEDRLLIETDSPWLAPEPMRGRRNEPSFVVRVAEVVAESRGESVEKVAEISFQNAERLFAVGHK